MFILGQTWGVIGHRRSIYDPHTFYSQTEVSFWPCSPSYQSTCTHLARMSVDNASAISRLSAHALSYAPPPSSPGLGVYDNTPLDVDSDGFLQSSHRAGGPYLCSLPALNIFSHPDWIMSREVNDILKKIDCILREAGIEYISLQVTGRAPMVDPENGGIPTLLITVPNDVPCGNWRDITKKIWNDCLSGHEPQGSVEILTLDVLHEPSPFLIEATDRIYSKWPQIRDSILEELDTEEWTGLECWRYGRWQERTRNPPTVIVSIKLDSVRGFNQDTKKILQILTQNDVEDCAVLFMKDEFRRYSYIHDLVPLARLTQCSQQAKPGMSIGIRDSSATSSTLGGVVELQMEGDSSWRRFNLACFHSIYPALPSEQEKLREIPGAQDSLERWKWNAPGFDDPLVKKVLQVDQPSLFDVEYAMKRALGDGNDTKRAEFQKFLDDKSYYLGEVCAGSGLQRTKNRVIEDGASKPCLMDWALIDVVKERQGPNQVRHPSPFP